VNIRRPDGIGVLHEQVNELYDGDFFKRFLELFLDEGLKGFDIAHGFIVPYESRVMRPF